jgi:hypothetical protein
MLVGRTALIQAIDWLKPWDSILRIAVKCLYTWPAEVDLIGDSEDENKRVY